MLATQKKVTDMRKMLNEEKRVTYCQIEKISVLNATATLLFLVATQRDLKSKDSTSEIMSEDAENV